MNIFSRIFLAIYSFCIAIFSLLLIGVPFNSWAYDWTSLLLRNYAMKWENVVIPAFFLCVSILFLVSGLKRKKTKVNGVTRHTTYGEVKITLQAIEGMAQKSIKTIPGLKDIKGVAKPLEDGLIIKITACALTDVNIPETTVLVQKNIKEYIEKYTGIVVKEVKVIIQDIGLKSKGRVE